MRIHPVVNISQVVRYRELIKRQRVEELKPVEVNKEEKQVVEKILNKQQIRGVTEYFVYQKEFMAEYDIWEKKKDLCQSYKL